MIRKANANRLLILLMLSIGLESARSAALLESDPEPTPAPAATEGAIEHTGLKIDAIRTQLDEYAPNGEENDDAWLTFLETDNLSMQKRWGEAISVLGSYTNASSNPYWLYKRALLNASLEKWMDAESDFAACVRNGPDHLEMRYRQLQALFFAGDMEAYLSVRRENPLNAENFPLLLLADHAAATTSPSNTCDWLNSQPVPQRCSMLVLVAQYYHTLSRTVHANLISEITDCVLPTVTEEASRSPHRELRDYARRLWDEHRKNTAQ